MEYKYIITYIINGEKEIFPSALTLTREIFSIEDLVEISKFIGENVEIKSYILIGKNFENVH